MPQMMVIPLQGGIRPWPADGIKRVSDVVRQFEIPDHEPVAIRIFVKGSWQHPAGPDREIDEHDEIIVVEDSVLNCPYSNFPVKKTPGTESGTSADGRIAVVANILRAAGYEALFAGAASPQCRSAPRKLVGRRKR